MVRVPMAKSDMFSQACRLSLTLVTESSASSRLGERRVGFHPDYEKEIRTETKKDLIVS